MKNRIGKNLAIDIDPNHSKLINLLEKNNSEMIGKL